MGGWHAPQRHHNCLCRLIVSVRSVEALPSHAIPQVTERKYQMDIDDNQRMQFVHHVLGEFETLIKENESVADYNLSYAREAKRIMAKLIEELE